jgi:hypothetical protein
VPGGWPHRSRVGDYKRPWGFLPLKRFVPCVIVAVVFACWYPLALDVDGFPPVFSGEVQDWCPDYEEFGDRSDVRQCGWDAALEQKLFVG